MKCPYCQTDFEGDCCPECGFVPQVKLSHTTKKNFFKKEIVFLLIASVLFICCVLAFPFFQSPAFIENDISIKESSISRSVNHITASLQLRSAMQEKLSLAQQADAASADEMSLIAPGDYTQLTRNPNDYQDMSVSCSAQILYDPQYTDEGIYFVFRSASPKEDTPMLYGIAFWAGEEEDLRLRDRSFVTLHGTVMGEHSYTDSYGYEDACPAIYLTNLEQSSYAEIYAPALTILSFDNCVSTVENCTVQVFKCEFAESETRVYLTIDNNGSSPISFIPSECVVQQANKKYPWKENLDADYPQFSGSLQPDEKKHMVLTFSSLDASQDMVLTLYLTNASGQRQSVEFSLSEISSEYLATES